MKPFITGDVSHAIAIRDRFSPSANAKIAHCGAHRIIIWESIGCIEVLSVDDYVSCQFGLKDWP